MADRPDKWAQWLTAYHASAEQSRRLLRTPAATLSGELFVTEIFGPTVQGEGPHVGRAATFVRLGGCALDCAWCDTEYSWRLDSAQERAFGVVPIPDLTTALTTAVARRVVVTGGEPLLQHRGVVELADGLTRDGVRVDVETSGTVQLGDLVDVADLIVVSPKLAHSGVARRRRLRLPVLREYVNVGATFKFVVETPADLAEIDQIVTELGVEPDHVFVTPQGVRSDVVVQRARAVADAVLARGWGLSPRWHVDLWGDERGR